MDRSLATQSISKSVVGERLGPSRLRRLSSHTMATQLTAARTALPTRRGPSRNNRTVVALVAGDGRVPQISSRRIAGYSCALVSTRGLATTRRETSSIRLSASKADVEPMPLPVDPLEMVQQASDAVQRAAEDGKLRQRIDFLLPINEKEFDFGATESMDYPCSIQKEYDTAVSVTKVMFSKILGDSAKISVKRIDAGGVEGEPCGVMTDSTKQLVAIIYPTSDKLKQIRQLAEEKQRVVLIVNPQWRESGQIVSDFGIGPWKKKAYEFLDTFEDSYGLFEKRIGAPGSVNAATGSRYGSGGVLRYLRSYPGKFETFAMAVDGSNQLLGVYDTLPSYKESEQIIEAGRAAKLEIFQRAMEVSKLQDEGMGPAEGVAVAAEPMDDPTLPLSEATIESMDAVQIRRALSARGIPASGKLSMLRKRG